MFWERALVALAVVVAALAAARVVDRRMVRRDLPPEAMTIYRVVRRSLIAAIVGIGVLSALMTLPAVRGVAGAVLGSAAVIGIVVGLAAQSTLANFVAGILIAFTQPVRLGDQVEVAGGGGAVEEIGLTYTFIRLDAGGRLVIPNSKLASDTIRNFTIVSRERVAEITLQVPLNRELGPVVEALREVVAGEAGAEAFVSGLDGVATLTVRARAGGEEEARRLEQALRLRVHERLRAEGVYA